MMKLKIPLISTTVLFLGIAAFWLVTTSRAATETAQYKVIRIEGKFEIRDYPRLTVATTRMEGDDMNGGFGRLFRFITGANEGSEKIAMTSPVLIDTAKDRKSMSFILPGKAVKKGVPKPTGDRVSLAKFEAARFAVLRFPGGRNAQTEKSAIEKLRTWLAAEKVATKGEPVFAYYDPPWTPIFMRRNEVMMRVDQTHQ